MSDPDPQFDKWLDEEWLYDVSGGDWEDLIIAMRKAYVAGWEMGYKAKEQEPWKNPYEI
jgi:hypothetical protein